MEPQKHTDVQTGKSSYLGPRGEKYSSPADADIALKRDKFNKAFDKKNPDAQFGKIPLLAGILWFVAASAVGMILQYVLDSHHTYPHSSLSVAIISIFSFVFNPFARILSIAMGASFSELLISHQFIMTVIINILSVIWLLIIGKLLAPKLPLFQVLFAKKSQRGNAVKLSFTKTNVVLFVFVIAYYLLVLILS